GRDGEDAGLFEAVRAVGTDLCPEQDLSFPVGKDSLSIQAQWGTGDWGPGIGMRKSVSPLSLIVTAFAPVSDVRRQLTPLMEREGESELCLIGLGGGLQRLGGSILAQCHPQAAQNQAAQHHASALPAFAGEGDEYGVPDLD